MGNWSMLSHQPVHARLLTRRPSEPNPKGSQLLLLSSRIEELVHSVISALLGGVLRKYIRLPGAMTLDVFWASNYNSSLLIEILVPDSRACNAKPFKYGKVA